MLFKLPNYLNKTTTQKLYLKLQSSSESLSKKSLLNEKIWSFVTAFLASTCLFLIMIIGTQPVQEMITPFLSPVHALQTLSNAKEGHEVLGFAPWWNRNKLENIDFTTLTTFAYFGIEIDSDGSLVTDDPGYTTFHSDQMTKLFEKAHQHGTRVVLTVTQMKNAKIEALLDDEAAQERAIRNIVREVKNRGIDGINIDIEYAGNPGTHYKNKFSIFVANLSEAMHTEIPNSRVSISVYASSARGKTLYDIAEIAKHTDKVFMMAYDFAVKGSATASPTAPLYGYESGKYSYDIATAVDDFLSQMPAEKLILGVPYYGYNYAVYSPEVNAQTRPAWAGRGRPAAQTYDVAMQYVKAEKEGWDEDAQVGWKAYYDPSGRTWRMLFLDDKRSLGIKYDFAKEQGLGGVGIWALGNDSDTKELWGLLKEKFGTNKLARGIVN